MRYEHFQPEMLNCTGDGAKLKRAFGNQPIREDQPAKSGCRSGRMQIVR